MTDPHGLREVGGRTVPGWVTYPRSILALCSVGWFLVQGGRLIVPPLAIPIRGTLGITNAQFGIAVTVLWGTYALAQFPSGIAADDLGHRTILVGSSLLAGLGFLGLVFATNYPLLMVACTVIGVGVGFFYITSRTFPSVLYGDDKGRALGITNAAGDVGGVIAPAAGAVIVGLAVSWRAAFLVVGLGAVLLAVASHLLVDGEYAVELPAIRPVTRSAVGEVTAGRVPLVILAYGLFALSWQASAAFIPLYMHEGKGLTVETGNLLLSLFFLAGVVVKPVAGWLSDRVGRRILSVGSLLGAGTTLFALALFVEGRLAVVAAVGLFGAALMVFPPVTQAYLMDAFADRSVGSAFGLTRTAYVLIGSTGPTIVGVGSGTIGYAPTFAGIAGGLILAAVLLVLATER